MDRKDVTPRKTKKNKNGNDEGLTMPVLTAEVAPCRESLLLSNDEDLPMPKLTLEGNAKRRTKKKSDPNLNIKNYDCDRNQAAKSYKKDKLYSTNSHLSNDELHKSKKVSRGKHERHKPEPTEEYFAPLKVGWVREVVTRQVPTLVRRDVYYHPPYGRKLRSTVEVQKYLLREGIVDLSVKNFTYYRDPLGFGPPFEVCRGAKPIVVFKKEPETKEKIIKHLPPTPKQEEKMILLPKAIVSPKKIKRAHKPSLVCPREELKVENETAIPTKHLKSGSTVSVIPKQKIESTKTTTSSDTMKRSSPPLLAIPKQKIKCTIATSGSETISSSSAPLVVVPNLKIKCTEANCGSETLSSMPQVIAIPKQISNSTKTTTGSETGTKSSPQARVKMKKAKGKHIKRNAKPSPLFVQQREIEESSDEEHQVITEIAEGDDHITTVHTEEGSLWEKKKVVEEPDQIIGVEMMEDIHEIKNISTNLAKNAANVAEQCPQRVVGNNRHKKGVNIAKKKILKENKDDDCIFVETGIVGNTDVAQEVDSMEFCPVISSVKGGKEAEEELGCFDIPLRLWHKIPVQQRRPEKVKQTSLHVNRDKVDKAHTNSTGVGVFMRKQQVLINSDLPEAKVHASSNKKAYNKLPVDNIAPAPIYHIYTSMPGIKRRSTSQIPKAPEPSKRSAAIQIKEINMDHFKRNQRHLIQTHMSNVPTTFSSKDINSTCFSHQSKPSIDNKHSINLPTLANQVQPVSTGTPSNSFNSATPCRASSSHTQAMLPFSVAHPSHLPIVLYPHTGNRKASMTLTKDPEITGNSIVFQANSVSSRVSEIPVHSQSKLPVNPDVCSYSVPHPP